MKKKILVITASFIPNLCDVIRDSSIEVFKEQNIPYDSFEVNGMWEVPYILNNKLKTNEYTGAIVNGVIISDDQTPYGSNMSLITHGEIVKASVKFDTPVAHAIIEASSMEKIQEILKIKGRNNEGKHGAIALCKLI
ncbi:MAG: 6,7-dimethyl-8-ribityllumazine synthase [Mycoplasmataceae bacterium]|nr:6,7-dimethyl-8-ribityllumazine synthase [Mycoplasmataceae bacterium]